MKAELPVDTQAMLDCLQKAVRAALDRKTPPRTIRSCGRKRRYQETWPNRDRGTPRAGLNLEHANQYVDELEWIWGQSEKQPERAQTGSGLKS